MEKFPQSFTSCVVPLNRAHVDTDAIMPKQYLKSIKRTGFAPFIFDEWRYLDKGYPGIELSQRIKNPDFVLNQTKYQDAQILLTQENFGCGSSREHAPWGLKEYGFKVIIAPSFADIFYSNSFKNGLLLIQLEQVKVEELFQYAVDLFKLTIQLKDRKIILENGQTWDFQLDEQLANRLLEGLDDIEITLKNKRKISAFEKKHYEQYPWLNIKIKI